MDGMEIKNHDLYKFFVYNGLTIVIEDNDEKIITSLGIFTLSLLLQKFLDSRGLAFELTDDVKKNYFIQDLVISGLFQTFIYSYINNDRIPGELAKLLLTYSTSYTIFKR